jgi:hypothetical protein
MALFAIQLVRVVVTSMAVQTVYTLSNGSWVVTELVIGINQMLNVIIRSFHFYLFCFTDVIYLARASPQQ